MQNVANTIFATESIGANGEDYNRLGKTTQVIREVKLNANVRGVVLNMKFIEWG